MSWSLQIAHGDLSFDGHQMGTVQGGQKLVQDLSCAVLEPQGTDPLHSSFGSTIGGSINPDGTWNQGVIGSPNNSLAAMAVSGEIKRICVQYQTQQLARYQADVAVYGRSTLTADEALMNIESIVAQAAQNHLLVSATLKTGTSDLPLTVPITPSI